MTLECRFKPGVGPLPIRFGMSRGEVEQCFGFKARQFFRTQSSAFPAHEYCHDDGTVFVYFTGSGTVEAVEFDDRARITWDNYLLTGRTSEDARRLFESKGFSSIGSLDVIVSPEVGISFWFPYLADEPERTAEAVLVARSEYFDEVKPI
ncbi:MULTISPECIES: hypothetical protein [unclassified Hyphomonas]|jgi:hypothetical protein|uniref:hypothetical protein n=2 Tax=Hyphomonas TaxID=85 RepID=UPI001A8E8F0E|nr:MULTISPECIES: hypothetical protein [unclassified Hyphomonas]QSR21757.1 hypothetical protein CFA77_05565 [Hyphomonas sp. KY3]